MSATHASDSVWTDYGGVVAVVLKNGESSGRGRPSRCHWAMRFFVTLIFQVFLDFIHIKQLIYFSVAISHLSRIVPCSS